MKNNLLKLKASISILIIALLFSSYTAKAEDLRRIVNLMGYWKFSIGTDSKWASPNYNDEDWDQIRVPNSWENEGYNDYNGYAWYRKKFRIGEISKNEPIYLKLGRIDDVDEVYINGKLVGKTGGFPPAFETAYNHDRKYTIPHEYLNFSGYNTIAVKVYDTKQSGGIVGGDIGIYRDEDFALLDYVISGKWKFKIGDNKEWRMTTYNDKSWMSVNVPSKWSQYGYGEYDGYGWYRKEFIVNQNFSDDELYLCLGRIDDYDQVFLNGAKVGDIFNYRKEKKFKKGREYRAIRVYKIPKGLLKTRGTNVLAVRVFDKTMDGGIYEGPIGVMTKTSYKKFSRKHEGWERESNSVFDFLFEF